MTSEQENNELEIKLLNNTFFKEWKSEENKHPNFSGLELVISGYCDQRCTYCYLTNSGDKLYPGELREEGLSLKNTKILFSYMEKEKLYPRKISIFLGEVLSQDQGFEILEESIKFFKGKPIDIIIPTNGSFIFDEEYLKWFDTLDRSNIHLSFSMDGKYADKHRPYFNENLKKDEYYYDKIFKFSKKCNSGFHPMIYSKSVSSWILNYEWFKVMFRLHNIPYNQLYMLEVRNDNWSIQNLKDYAKFLRYLYRDILNDFKTKYEDKEELVKAMLKENRFNMFSPLANVGRGIGCGIQSMLYVRMGDLNVFPCHRLMYNTFKLFNFKTENDEIVGIENCNPSLHSSILSLKGENLPYCETCFLKHFCGFGCLGSQNESIGDLFTPIPTVCALHHMKFKVLVDIMREFNLLNSLFPQLTKNKVNTLKLYLNDEHKFNNNQGVNYGI